MNGFVIRYVQNDHKNKEPNSDLFSFHVTDGINESPTYKFFFNIEVCFTFYELGKMEKIIKKSKFSLISKYTFSYIEINLILILLKPVNDEPPKALFQPLYVEFNKYSVLDNDTFFIVDLDSKPEDILISVEEYPRYGNENFNLN